MSKNSKTKIVVGYFLTFIVIAGFVSLLTFYMLKTFNSDKSSFKGVIERNSEIELVLVYIGCSVCGAAQHPDLPNTFKKLSKNLETVADSLGYDYLTIGISNEKLIKDGLQHLEKVLDFDEIAIGNGMGNTSVQRYIWDTTDNIYDAGIPQVLILRRQYELQDQDQKISSKIEKEEVIIRRLGIEGVVDIINSKVQIVRNF
jgi:heme/copper-type cytochrome/quinol oxidase subunit 2